MVTEIPIYFDSLSRHWSEKYAVDGSMRHRIERFARPLREGLPPGSKVLDFGCGTGEIGMALARVGFEVTGFDTSPGMLEVARRNCAGTSIEFIGGELNGISKVPISDRTFKGIVASSVLEYAAKPQAQLAELARILDDRGLLVMSVPNPAHRSRRLERLLRPITQSALASWIHPVLSGNAQAYRRYLALSINHLPLGRWIEMAEQAGLRVSDVSIEGLPLTRIIAVRVSA